MTTLIDWLLLAWMLPVTGALAIAPWRAASLLPEERRPWALAALPLLVSAGLAMILHLEAHPDAALEQHLVPLSASHFSQAAVTLFGALLVASGIGWLGWRGLEPAGWRVNAGFGFALLLLASLAGELLRVGEGPTGRPWVVFALAFCRLLLALGTGEALAPGRLPGRPVFAPWAAAALPAYWLLLPAPIASALAADRTALTFAAGAVLLGAARWLPARLRRPALAAAALLGGLALALAIEQSRRLGVIAVP
jgi:hypothetical protein